MSPRRGLAPWTLLIAGALIAGCSSDLGVERPAPIDTPPSDVAQPTTETLPDAPDSRGATVLKLDDDRSVISFTGSRPSIEHTRSFSRFDGQLHLQNGEPVYIEVVVDMTSIVEKPDDRLVTHLKTSDFFDVVRFPAARFRSSEIKRHDPPDGQATHLVKGAMEFHGKAVPLEFPATLVKDGDLLRGQAELHIDRHAYDVNYQMHRDDPISATVVLIFDLVFEPPPHSTGP